MWEVVGHGQGEGASIGDFKLKFGFYFQLTAFLLSQLDARRVNKV